MSLDKAAEALDRALKGSNTSSSCFPPQLPLPTPSLPSQRHKYYAAAGGQYTSRHMSYEYTNKWSSNRVPQRSRLSRERFTSFCERTPLAGGSERRSILDRVPFGMGYNYSRHRDVFSTETAANTVGSNTSGEDHSYVMKADQKRDIFHSIPSFPFHDLVFFQQCKHSDKAASYKKHIVSSRTPLLECPHEGYLNYPPFSTTKRGSRVTTNSLYRYGNEVMEVSNSLPKGTFYKTRNNMPDVDCLSSAAPNGRAKLTSDKCAEKYSPDSEDDNFLLYESFRKKQVRRSNSATPRLLLRKPCNNNSDVTDFDCLESTTNSSSERTRSRSCSDDAGLSDVDKLPRAKVASFSSDGSGANGVSIAVGSLNKTSVDNHKKRISGYAKDKGDKDSQIIISSTRRLPSNGLAFACGSSTGLEVIELVSNKLRDVSSSSNIRKYLESRYRPSVDLDNNCQSKKFDKISAVSHTTLVGNESCNPADIQSAKTEQNPKTIDNKDGDIENKMHIYKCAVNKLKETLKNNCDKNNKSARKTKNRNACDSLKYIRQKDSEILCTGDRPEGHTVTDITVLVTDEHNEHKTKKCYSTSLLHANKADKINNNGRSIAKQICNTAAEQSSKVEYTDFVTRASLENGFDIGNADLRQNDFALSFEETNGTSIAHEGNSERMAQMFHSNEVDFVSSSPKMSPTKNTSRKSAVAVVSDSNCSSHKVIGSFISSNSNKSSNSCSSISNGCANSSNCSGSSSSSSNKLSMQPPCLEIVCIGSDTFTDFATCKKPPATNSFVTKINEVDKVGENCNSLNVKYCREIKSKAVQTSADDQLKSELRIIPVNDAASKNCFLNSLNESSNPTCCDMACPPYYSNHEVDCEKRPRFEVDGFMKQNQLHFIEATSSENNGKIGRANDAEISNLTCTVISNGTQLLCDSSNKMRDLNCTLGNQYDNGSKRNKINETPMMRAYDGFTGQFEYDGKQKSEEMPDSENFHPLDPSKYKTELCRAFQIRGSCRYGSRCNYAHGLDQLKVSFHHGKYKTRNCQAYHETGYCRYGARCSFIHDLEEGILKCSISNKEILEALHHWPEDESTPAPTVTWKVFNRPNEAACLDDTMIEFTAIPSIKPADLGPACDLDYADGESMPKIYTLDTSKYAMQTSFRSARQGTCKIRNVDEKVSQERNWNYGEYGSMPFTNSGYGKRRQTNSYQDAMKSNHDDYFNDSKGCLAKINNQRLYQPLAIESSGETLRTSVKISEVDSVSGHDNSAVSIIHLRSIPVQESHARSKYFVPPLELNHCNVDQSFDTIRHGSVNQISWEHSVDSSGCGVSSELPTFSKHTILKRRKCISFHNKGFCLYGTECQFLHDE